MSKRAREMTDSEKWEQIRAIERGGEMDLDAERAAWRQMKFHDSKGVREAAEGIDGFAMRCGIEPVDEDTPLELALESERRRERMRVLEEQLVGISLGDIEKIEGFLKDSLELAKLEGEDRLLDMLFADGWHPGKVMMRVYGLAMVRKRELVQGMSYTDYGAMVGRGRAAISARMKLLFPDAQLKTGKSPGAKRKMAKKAVGNSNRSNGSKKK